MSGPRTSSSEHGSSGGQAPGFVAFAVPRTVEAWARTV